MTNVALKSLYKCIHNIQMISGINFSFGGFKNSFFSWNSMQRERNYVATSLAKQGPWIKEQTEVEIQLLLERSLLKCFIIVETNAFQPIAFIRVFPKGG